jgi:hypothetical protein
MPDEVGDLDYFDFHESDCVAIFEDSSGSVRTAPILVDKEGVLHVQVGELFYPPEQLPHLLRVERKPSARPRPDCAPLPHHAATSVSRQPPLPSVRERLAEALERWAKEDRAKRVTNG